MIKKRDTEDLNDIFNNYDYKSRYSEYNDADDDRYDTNAYQRAKDYYTYQNLNSQNINKQRTFFAKKDVRANEYDYYRPKRKKGCCLSFSCGCIVGFFLLILLLFISFLISFNDFMPVLSMIIKSLGLF